MSAIARAKPVPTKWRITFSSSSAACPAPRQNSSRGTGPAASTSQRAKPDSTGTLMSAPSSATPSDRYGSICFLSGTTK
ncbi:MAG: hypothetical protein NTW97_05105 [Candidatus Krumholzibacteria bacterium]|nr:hypothetical protein [Candidatus Krumholzibacteria bacterium]